MLKKKMKHQMLKVKNFWKLNSVRTILRGFLRQLFFLFTAIFLFFSLIFVVNALSLKFTTPPDFSYKPLHIVIFSPTVDLTLFYLSSTIILLFPLLVGEWIKSWKWAIASYLPLPLSLAGFFFQMMALGQFFLWLACIVCLFWIFIRLIPKSRNSFQSRTALANVLVYVCTFFLFIELLSFFFWLLYPFLNFISLESFLRRMAIVELEFFYLPTFSVPFFIFFNLFAWFLAPFRLWLKNARSFILRFAGKELDLKKTLSVDLNSSGFKILDRKPLSMLFLVLSLLLSVVYGFYAYRPLFYGREGFIGVDVRYYVDWLENMRDGDFLHGLSYAFFNLSDRPLSVSILYFFSVLFRLPSVVVAQFSPLVIGPLVVFATYFFMREAGFPDGTSVLVGFFSCFSFLMTIGVHAAFISNMMAWIALLFFSGFLIKTLRMKSWFFCLLASGALVSILFMHVYTWSVTMFALFCLGFVLLLRRFHDHSSVFNWKLISVIAASNAITEFIRQLVVSMKGFSAKTVIGVAQTGLSLSFAVLMLNSLLQTYFCSFLTNPFMLFLGAFGVLTVVGDFWQKDFCLFLKCWIMAPSIFFIFGDWVVQTRILYLMPFHILGALGVVFLDCWVRQHFKSVCGRIFAILLVLLLLLVNVNYGLRSMDIISTLDFS